MTHLSILLKSRGIDFDARDRQVICYAHCIDLASKAAIGTLPNEDTLQDDDVDDEDVLHRHPITLARAVVRAIRGSNLRREEFNEVITQGNSKGRFKSVDGEVITVRPLQLLRDVRTRWDSCYRMLERLQGLRPVCAVLNLFFV
jgi:hypothetical protein